jgi:flagellar motor switch/type III secretory pathway protein FliN
MTNTIDPERLSWLGDVPLEVEVAIHCGRRRVSEIAPLQVGSLIPTPVGAGAEIEIFAGGARIGCGELSICGDRAMVRITRLGSGD